MDLRDKTNNSIKENFINSLSHKDILEIIKKYNDNNPETKIQIL